MSERTLAISNCLDRLRQGDDVRHELLQFAFERLVRMTHKMKKDFDRVGRWEATDDVFQNASMRLYRALEDVQVEDVRHFFRLAALQIRRELTDLCRHYQGPLGAGANHHTVFRQKEGEGVAPPAYDRAETTSDPQLMQEWSEFHQCVGELSDREREVFELLWYHELGQEEVADLMGISTRQVKRIWRSAKLALHDRLNRDN